MKYIISIFFIFQFQIIYSQNIDSSYFYNNIKQVLTELSKDDYEGRLTGHKSGRKAANFIIDHLSTIFKNYNNVRIYKQNFDFNYNNNPHNLSKNGLIKTAQNILCFIDNKKEETIILGAHYDHLGYGEFGSLYNGSISSIHNGADDNASGVSLAISLLELLNICYNNYNFLFIGFDGEEMGLYGSSYFCKNPTEDLGKVKYMLNFDMVGRLNDNKELAINGVGTSESWLDIIDEKKNDFNLILSKSGIGPSDHSSFYIKEIPAIHFFTGQHGDYHKPIDDNNKINYDGLFEILFFVKDIVQKSFSINNFEFQETTTEINNTPKFTVTLGVMPDYLFSGKGMRIDGISKNKTAHKYGLMKGDIVLKMGEVEVENMMDYMIALSKFNKGESTQVEILRKNKIKKVDITFQ